MIKFLTSTLHNELAKEYSYFKRVPSVLHFSIAFYFKLTINHGKRMGTFEPLIFVFN